MDSFDAFDAVCEKLEALTGWTKLQARGTLRLALIDAGLPSRVSAHQLRGVIERELPAKLRASGIEGDLAQPLARVLDSETGGA